MQAFLVKVVVTAALQLIANPQFQAWAQSLLAGAVSDLETKIDALPAAIIGNGYEDVAHAVSEIVGTTDQIAGSVKTEVSPLFSGVTLNPSTLEQLADQLVNAINPFKEEPRR